MKKILIGLFAAILAIAVLFVLPASAAQTDEIPSFETAQEAVSFIRTQCKGRVADFSLFCAEDEALTADGIFRYEGSAPDESDYLMWSIASFTATRADDGRIRFQVQYRSTAAEEEKVTAAVAEIAAAAPQPTETGAAADYLRALYVYRYLTENKSILTANESASAYNPYTAYAAVVKNAAKCEGFALAYYRIARTLGLDCRILTGKLTIGGQAVHHAWNAVKLGDCWYGADVWMGAAYAGGGEDPLPWFLSLPASGAVAYRPIYEEAASGASLSSRTLLTPREIEDYPFNAPFTGVCGGAAWSLDPAAGTLAVSAAADAGASYEHWSVFLDKIETVLFAGDADAWCVECMNGLHKPIHFTGETPAFAALRDAGETCHLLGDVDAVPATCKEAGREAGFGCETCGYYHTGGEAIPASDAHTDRADGRCAVCGIALDCKDHGFCGEDVRWYLTKENELVLTGAGEMLDYPDESFTPWYAYRNGVTRVTIESGIKNAGDRAFAHCDNLADVSLSPELERIGAKCFSYASSLTAVSIPDSVTEIGEYCFERCGALRDVQLPAALKRLSNCAFTYTDVRSIRIPASLEPENTGENLFAYSSLETIEFESGVTTIPNKFCDSAQELHTVVLPESVTEICDNAFYRCSNIEAIDLPQGLRLIGENAFAQCFRLKDITIPDSVEKIGKQAFWYCQSLQKIEIPEGVTMLNGTFYQCGALTEVILPDSVTEIINGCFRKCGALSAVQLPKNLKTLAGWCFAESGLNHVTIPENVTKIGIKSFYGCASLTSLTILGGNDLIIDPTLFDECPQPPVIHCAENTKTRILQYLGNGYTGSIHTDLQYADAIPAAVCSASAEILFYCGDCERSFSVYGPVDADGHTIVEDAAVAPTCTMPGKTAGSHCAACGTVVTEQTAIPAAGHTPQTVPEVAPTCTEAGLTAGVRCAVCRNWLQAQGTISPLGHTDETGPDGKPDQICDRCGEPIPTQENVILRLFTRLYEGFSNFLLSFIKLFRKMFG